jgi:hypothetical protein
MYTASSRLVDILQEVGEGFLGQFFFFFLCLCARARAARAPAPRQGVPPVSRATARVTSTRSKKRAAPPNVYGASLTASRRERRCAFRVRRAVAR